MSNFCVFYIRNSYLQFGPIVEHLVYILLSLFGGHAERVTAEVQNVITDMELLSKVFQVIILVQMFGEF